MFLTFVLVPFKLFFILVLDQFCCIINFSVVSLIYLHSLNQYCEFVFICVFSVFILICHAADGHGECVSCLGAAQFRWIVPTVWI